MNRDRLRDALEGARDDLPVAVLAALGAIGGSYAVTGWTDRFVLVPIDRFVVTATPAPIVNWTILNLGETGRLLHQGLATAIAVVAFGAVAFAGRGLARWFRDHTVGVVAGATSAGLLAFLVTGSLLSTVAAAVGLGFVLAVGAVAVETTPRFRSRRQVLGLAGVVGGFLGLSYLAGRSPIRSREPNRCRTTTPTGRRFRRPRSGRSRSTASIHSSVRSASSTTWISRVRPLGSTPRTGPCGLRGPSRTR